MVFADHQRNYGGPSCNQSFLFFFALIHCIIQCEINNTPQNERRPDEESGRCLFLDQKSLRAWFMVTIRGTALRYIGGCGDPLAGCASLAILSSCKRPISTFESGSILTR